MVGNKKLLAFINICLVCVIKTRESTPHTRVPVCARFFLLLHVIWYIQAAHYRESGFLEYFWNEK